ncbi:MAG: hypothetical protein JW889_06940 [Verrucomicrobia bacterium]|nr:hypothetical protein [Verrucomicrobiota bacterium]
MTEKKRGVPPQQQGSSTRSDVQVLRSAQEAIHLEVATKRKIADALKPVRLELVSLRF